ncbi:hypothetical protein Tco_1258464 [Tanacetum coccineum]
MPLTTVPVVMKPMQSMSSLVTPVRRYGNLASGYESYMLAVHSELPNSTQRNVHKPLGKRGPLDPIVVQSHSKTVYPRRIHQLFEITKSTYPDLCRVYTKIPNAIADLLGSLTSDIGIRSADKPIICSMTSSRSRSSSRTPPTSYLNVGAVRHNLLRGGNSALGMSSLWSTGGGMDSGAGSGGSGDDGNGNDVGTGGGKCSDDGRGGSCGEGI